MQTAAVGKLKCLMFVCVMTAAMASTGSVDAQLFRRYQGHSNGYSHSNRDTNRTSRYHSINVKLPSTAADRIDVILPQIDRAIANQATHWDTSQTRSPWGVMHNSLAWGVQGEILIDGKRHNSISSLCENQTLKTVKILKAEEGKLVPIEGPGLQGHPGQLLAILAQNAIAAQQPIRFDGLEFTVEDLIEFEKSSCATEKELTFKLLALNHYCGTNAEWKNAQDEDWSVERLLREELKQPINGVTCGGTHRLMAIGLAIEKRRREAEKLDGIWESAATYLSDYHDYAFSLMNPDGSFSTDWFERRAAASDMQKRLQTTGHVLEWMVVTLPVEEMENEKLQRSIYYLSQLLQTDIGEPWSIGPRAHALRALRLYKLRVEELHTEAVELVANTEEGLAESLESEVR